MENTTSQIQTPQTTSSTRQHANAFNVQLARYESVSSEELENKAGWVDYGLDNNYPNYLIELFQNSPIHNAICVGTAEMIAGKGFKSDPKTMALLERWKCEKQILSIASDVKIQGGEYLEVIPTRDFKGIAQVNHLPFENVRVAYDEDTDKITGVWYSKDWNDKRKKKNKPYFIPLFKGLPTSPDDITPTRYVVYNFKQSVGSNYYPRPDYFGALHYIEIAQQIGVFHLNNILNGFFPSIIAQFNNGQPDPEKAGEVVRNMERNLSGARNAGKMVVLFNDNPDTKAIFETFPLTDADKQYDLVQETAKEMVFVGHRVTSPLMFGIRDSSGLGNNANELTESMAVYMDKVVKPYRKMITDVLEDLVYAETGVKPVIEIVDAMENDLPVVDDAAKQSYNGAQIASAIDIIAKIKEGILTEEQAIVFLVQFLQLPEDIARSFFNEQLRPMLSAHVCCSKEGDKLTPELEKELIEKMEECADEIDADEWELVDDQPAHDTHEDEEKALSAWIEKQSVQLSLTGYAKGDEKSKWGDTGLYKLRYSYSQNLSEGSREFCKRMVELSQQNKVFRYEDIKMMGDDGVNGQFAPQGSSTYDIFAWKGGVYCHHFWKRQIYFRKTEKGRFLPNDGLKNDKRVGNVPFVPQKGVEGIAPINTPTRGSLKNT